MATNTTAQRLQILLNSKGINQTEMLEACNRVCRKNGWKELGKSAISQYLNGKVVPKQDKIFIIAEAMGVNPAWLMGFDVPMQDVTKNPSAEYYESIGVAARMKPTPAPAPTTDDILAQLQSLERQLKTQVSLSATEQQLISDFRALPKSAQGKVRAYIDGLFDRLEGK